MSLLPDLDNSDIGNSDSESENMPSTIDDFFSSKRKKQKVQDLPDVKLEGLESVYKMTEMNCQILLTMLKKKSKQSEGLKKVYQSGLKTLKTLKLQIKLLKGTATHIDYLIMNPRRKYSDV